MAGRTVYVGNISAATPEGALREVFGRAGAVTDLRIAGKPGYNNVYCFVEFLHPSSAKMAVSMNGTQLGGNTIRVSMAKTSHASGNTHVAQDNPHHYPSPVQPQPMAAFNFDPALAAALSAYTAALPAFTAALPAYTAAMPSNIMQAEAHARLLNLPAFNAQLSHSNIQTRNSMKPKKPHHNPEKINRTIYIESVAAAVNEQAIADHFRLYGSITAVRLANTSDTQKRKAWIEFSSEGAASAAQRCSNLNLAGSVMKVRPSRTAIHTNTLADPPATSHAQEVQAAALAHMHAQLGLPQTASKPSLTQHTQTQSEPQQPSEQQPPQQQEQSSDLTSSTSFPNAASSPPASTQGPVSLPVTTAEPGLRQIGDPRKQAAAAAAMQTTDEQQDATAAGEMQRQAVHDEMHSSESSPQVSEGRIASKPDAPLQPSAKRSLDKATSTDLDKATATAPDPDAESMAKKSKPSETAP